MLRLLSIIAVLLVATLPAQARDPRDRYQEASLRTLTSYVVQNGLIPLTTESAFSEFVNVTECDIMEYVKDNPFRQQEVRNTFNKNISTLDAVKLPPLNLKLNTTLLVTGYNFDTQSITILPRDQLKNVSSFTLVENDPPLCNGQFGSELTALPYIYSMRANTPISFLRIPLQKEVAEALLNKLDRYLSNDKYMIIYVTFYVQVDPIAPQTIRYGRGLRGVLVGQLNSVDLFVDKSRKVLFKRLNYADNY